DARHPVRRTERARDRDRPALLHGPAARDVADRRVGRARRAGEGRARRGRPALALVRAPARARRRRVGRAPRAVGARHAAGATPGSRPLYRRLWAAPPLSFAFVTPAPGAQLGTVEAAIAARLGERHRLRVRPTASLIAFFADQVRQAFSLAYLLELITLILVS